MALDPALSPSLESLGRAFAQGVQFVVWIGSGTSRSSGLPSWATLRAKLQAVLTTRSKRADASPNLKTIAETAARVPDHWDALEILKAQLGSDYYRLVRESLSTSGITPPATLNRVWGNPNVDGIVSLNLEDLALKAFNERYAGRQTLAHADGTNLPLALRLLNESPSFLVQLHGTLALEKTWVLTKSDRETLLSNPQYKRFIEACLIGRRVLFLGCSPDDVAVKLHFDRLAEVSEYLPDHYWLVPRSDLTDERRKGLEKMNVGLIEFDVTSTTPEAISAEHDAAIIELFDYLEKYQYEDAPSDPINPMTRPITERLPPARVQSMEPEQARNILSSYASAILEIEDKAIRTEKYGEFLREYAAAISVASTVHQEPGAIFFGMKFEEKIGGGAFSHVWRAQGKDGATLKAVKLVHKQVADDATRLNSFRTGVSSMRILSGRGVDGMVAYDSAHEIPPCVVMPFLDGENLEVAAKRPTFALSSDGISVARRVAQIVKSAHDLPERVLHRDIRPANIMIKAQQSADEPPADRVVVLDFDLSWHECAESDSAISQHMATVLSYLAPEQLKDSEDSRRHPKVDSYGLCMTLMFLGRREHPEPHIRRSRDWEPTLASLGSGIKLDWKSWLPRLRRLIHEGTEAVQDDRLEFDHVVRELVVLEGLALGSLASPEKLQDAPLEVIAEEVFAQIIQSDRYQWTTPTRTAFYEAIKGTNAELSEIKLQGDRAYKLTFRRQQKGDERYADFDKFWRPRLQQFDTIMKRGGWIAEQSAQAATRDIGVVYLLRESDLRAAPLAAANAGREIWNMLRN